MYNICDSYFMVIGMGIKIGELFLHRSIYGQFMANYPFNN